MTFNIKSILRKSVIAAAFLWTGLAHAGLYGFTLAGDYSAHWKLEAPRTLNWSIPGEVVYIIDVGGLRPGPMEGIFPGAEFDQVDLAFHSEMYGGGVEILDYYSGNKVLFSGTGAQLYNGVESSPWFKIGVFTLTEVGGTRTSILTITDVTPVPEVETYSMLLAGLGLLGVVSRRRKPRA